jgi:hypothetical protein
VGEFDLFSLTDLRKTLNGILALCKRTLIDLSGITFLDLDFARGLALRLQLYAHYLTLHDPPPGDRKR